jgi:hypothetical protein
MSEDTDARRSRRVPDFVLMCAVVAVALVVGGIVLAVVGPRGQNVQAGLPVPPVTAAGRTSHPGAAPSAADAAACATQRALADRLVAVPPGHEAQRAFWLNGLPDSEKVAQLWQSRWATDMGDYLGTHAFQACRYWMGTGVTAAVLSFDTAANARAVLFHAVAGLPAGPQAVAGGTFAFAEVGSQWVEGDRGGGFAEDVALLTRGQYLALIIVTPADAAARELMQTLAQQQYDLLPAA